MATDITAGEAVNANNPFKTKLIIGTKNVGNLLKSYSVTKIKQVKNSQTASDGSVVYDKIPGWIYKLQLEFLPLTQTQLTSLATLFTNFEVSVSFYNPYTGSMVEGYNMYPNDQTSSIMYYWGTNGTDRILYNNMSLNLIGIRCIS